MTLWLIFVNIHLLWDTLCYVISSFSCVLWCAYLNLIIQEGLKVIDGSLQNIKISVKYVKAALGRRVKFAKCISQSCLKTGKKM